MTELRRRGVSWGIAHGSVDNLDPQWVDEQMDQVDALGYGADQRASELERRLRSALETHPLQHYRTTAAWIEYEGRSGHVDDGLWADTPWPAAQGIIYALHLGARNEELLRDFPGRSAWIWAWDASAHGFRLKPWRFTASHRHPD